MISVAYLKVLSDETRLRIFRSLVQAPDSLCVAELEDILQKPQYAVSRGLAELRKAGLIQEFRRKKFVFYAPTSNPSIVALGQWVSEFCECETAGGSTPNHDGSGGPGAEPCAYDGERLRWRISLRKAGSDVLTGLSSQMGEDHRPRVLFVCVHNSARSQLAEEYLRTLAGEMFQVFSAGITPGTLNPHVVAVLAEEGIDISQKPTRAVTDLYFAGQSYDWVITVCSREAERECPIFPGPVQRESWPFPDPAHFVGSEGEVRVQVRDLGHQIRLRVQEFVARCR